MWWWMSLGCSQSNSDFEGLSNGQCPDVTQTVQSEFKSSGKKRRVQIVIPDAPREPMNLMYTFHGLNPKSSDPITQVTKDNDLQRIANDTNTAMVVPEALATTIGFLGDFLLWGILGDEEDDLVLFDDLQICMTETWGIDAEHVSVWGHSGGALWTSLLTMQRPDVFSAAAEFSGGSDVVIGVPGLSGPWVIYDQTPDIPYMLSTAGAADVWPDETLAVLDFQASTSSLESQLVDDGRFTIRCEHNLGHYKIPLDQWEFAAEWLTVTERGSVSPYSNGELALHTACNPSTPSR